MTRCRICSTNDREALIDDMAQAMWLTQESSTLDDEWRKWEHAGPYWQNIMREFATASLAAIEAKVLA